MDHQTFVERQLDQLDFRLREPTRSFLDLPASTRATPANARSVATRLASFLRKQGKPVYDETITAEEKSALDGIEMEKDDLYDEAARIVVSSGQASISYLQRKLRIGFSRAARMSRGAPVLKAISSKRCCARAISRSASSAHFSPITFNAASIEQILGSAVRGVLITSL